MIILFTASDYITQMNKKQPVSAYLRRAQLEENKTVMPGVKLSTQKSSRILLVLCRKYT